MKEEKEKTIRDEIEDSFGESPVRSEIGEIFATLKILNIISQAREFKNWIEREHQIHKTDDTFEGYKFFILVLMRNFLNAILDSNPTLPFHIYYSLQNSGNEK